MSRQNNALPQMVEPLWSTYIHQKGARLGLPVTGTFELTPRCNFNCNMCYVHGSCHRWLNLICNNNSIIWKISKVKRFRSLQYLYHSFSHILNISNTLLHIRIIH